MWAWINGVLTPLAEGTVAVNDHGFTVGDGVFETLKINDGVAVTLTRHLRRLARSAAGMGLPEPDEALVRQAVQETLAAGVSDEGVLRITYTSGPGPLGSARGDGGGTLAVVAIPGLNWPAVSSVVVSPWPRNDRSPLTGLKTTSYAENVVCLAHARARGGDEALLANLAGDLCEGTGTNVFVVLDGQVFTPPLSDGCLAGITRDLIVEWFDVIEKTMPLSILDSAHEVFLTSSTRDIHPVGRVGDRVIDAPGPTTRQLAQDYARRIRQDPDPA